MTQHDQAISRLREAVETTVGRKMRTPKDFDFACQQIMSVTGNYVSATTLKRMWGYLSEPVTPRRSTLDILAQYVGKTDWQAFLDAPLDETSSATPLSNDKTDGLSSADSSAVSDAGDSPVVDTNLPKPRHPFWRSRWAVCALLFLLIAVAVGLWVANRPSKDDGLADVQNRVLRRGETFSSYAEYFRLFNLKPDYRPHYQDLPGLPNIKLWTPLYRHPRWGNDGDSARLMPTITEHFKPESPSSKPDETVSAAIVNKERYLKMMEDNDVRITFMKGLVDTTIVFLGVYCMSYSQSDTSKVVWECVSDSCDLGSLPSLNRYRH